MKRMTAEEVAEQFEAMGASAGGAWNHAAQIVRENLIPQWHDEPDGDGWYWVECDTVMPYRAMRRDDGSWAWFCNGYATDNFGRCCPIGARPQ